MYYKIREQNVFFSLGWKLSFPLSCFGWTNVSVNGSIDNGGGQRAAVLFLVVISVSLVILR